ncbi:MAG TPA: response regulator [Noviherbaspirillum sp.]|jgi:CheY-like chemotaxis protein|uniref:response regulator n=1 Tax=Noviherbaspirillum sp. TaxID=1926288 RepID=UPI002F92865A
MSQQAFPFAVRLLGFSHSEEERIAEHLAQERERGFRYLVLEEDNLQDPDLHVANADDLHALATVNDLCPSEIRPALLVGAPAVDLPHPCVPRPYTWQSVLAVLDRLVVQRADALSRLQASDVVRVAERRRRHRPDLDLGDPAQYEKMRRKVPEDGMVLVVDRNPALYDVLADLLLRYKVPVEWVNSETDAIALREQRPVALLLLNTSTPHVDPYRLCWAMQEQDSPLRMACALLVGPHFVYDREQARFAGVDGFLRKPLSTQHLMALLRRFLPSVR